MPQSDTQSDALKTVNTRIQQRIQTVLEECLAKCQSEEDASMREALLLGYESLSEEDVRASILAEFLEGIYHAEEHYVAKLADLGYDA